MSRAAGTGTPIWFMCAKRRRDRVWPESYPEGHKVTLTGRTKPNRSRNIGARVSRTIREYQCTCGHVGWSNHYDLEVMESRTDTGLR